MLGARAAKSELNPCGLHGGGTKSTSDFFRGGLVATTVSEVL